MTAPSLDWLSDRDRQILHDLARARLLTGAQIERLYFWDFANSRAAGSSRRRSMQRLSTLHLVTTLPRRVGGERAGSAGLVYTLDAAGQRWLTRNSIQQGRVRRPWAIGSVFVDHTLAVAELFVRLREQERAGLLKLVRFDAEPASWHRSPAGLLKPDAYAVWISGRWEQHVWYEVDRSTESLPTLRRKLLGYVDAATGGDVGPDGVLPRVVVTVLTAQRLEAVQHLISQLPSPGSELITSQLFATTATDQSASTNGARPPPA